MSPFRVQAQQRGEKKTAEEKLNRWDFGKDVSDPTQNAAISKFSFNLLVALFLLQGLSSLRSVFL